MKGGGGGPLMKAEGRGPLMKVSGGCSPYGRGAGHAHGTPGLAAAARLAETPPARPAPRVRKRLSRAHVTGVRPPDAGCPGRCQAPEGCGWARLTSYTPATLRMARIRAGSWAASGRCTV